MVLCMGGMRGFIQGVCVTEGGMHDRGGVHGFMGGMRGFIRGACVMGGMCDGGACVAGGGHVWFYLEGHA